MNEGQSINLLLAGGSLVLVLSALTARRLRVGPVVKMVVGWSLIFTLVYVLFSYRGEVRGVWERATAGLVSPDQTISGEALEVRLSRDGHYWVNADVNGVRTRFLIDSGATVTGLSRGAAERAGVSLDEGGLPVVLSTANGQIRAQRGRIERLNIGPLVAEDLQVVVSESFGDINVVGMNFLSKLKSWRVESGTLILEPNPAPVTAG